MTKNEFMTQIETLVGKLATTASPIQDKQQVQLLREDLLQKAYEILEKKLNERIAYCSAANCGVSVDPQRW